MSSPRRSGTIFALSTPPGKSAIAVVRISGPESGASLQALGRRLPPPRHASLRRLRHPGSGEPIDDALVLWLPGPGTETGEDMAELHVHGGRAVIRATLQALGEIDGLRPAEAGEFVLRAFRNGRIDLTAAEATADLIDAETEGQRRQAMRQASGALTALYDRWRQRIIEAQALVEAAIDFSDEGDVGKSATTDAQAIAAVVAREMASHLADDRRGEVMREGFRVVIAGPPNAGKSSLLNALARREAAIVSDEAGTTRDVIEVLLDLAGLPVVLTDTAGIREAEGQVEREGIRRALARVRDAQLVLWLSEATAPLSPPLEALGVEAHRVLPVPTKADLLGPGDRPAGAISVRDGLGVEELVQEIAGRAAAMLDREEAPVMTRARHRLQIERGLQALDRFRTADELSPELAAEELRIAAYEIGRIAGRVDVEDILDQVFSRFCIGK